MNRSNIKSLPHRKHFRNKFLKYLLAAVLFLIFSLFIGTVGYKYFFHLSWIDGFYNASLILTGMGPVDVPPGNVAKIFASLYAVYSGVAFLTTVALLFAPILHRFLHKFHLDIED